MAGGEVQVSKVLCLQAADEHVIDSADKKLFEGFIGCSVLFEVVCGFSEEGTDVVDHVACGKSRDDGQWARVGRGGDEGNCQESGIDCRGDG